MNTTEKTTLKLTGKMIAIPFDPPPPNDAETLMTECLDRESKHRAEIYATVPQIESPENRSTAFAAGLQTARINALETALRALIEAAGQCCELWGSGTPVHPHALVAMEMQDAVESARKSLA